MVEINKCDENKEKQNEKKKVYAISIPFAIALCFVFYKFGYNKCSTDFLKSLQSKKNIDLNFIMYEKM